MPVIFRNNPIVGVGDDDYPTQSKKSKETGFAGEIRLYYGSDPLKPKSSRFGPVRIGFNGKVKDHSGVDIFCPSRPFPREIPFVAICDGEVTFVFDDERPNDIGHRAQLRPTGGGPEVILYGHLSRFEGRSRKVKSGDIIGYGGCSGNADTAGECRVASTVVRMNSGHLHLGWMIPKPKPKETEFLDPLEQMGWRLRFDKPDDTISFKEWNKRGHQLPAADEAPPIREALHLHRNIELGRPRPTSDGTPPAPLARLGWIEVARKAAMQSTLTCYGAARSRLEAPRTDPGIGQFHEWGLNTFEASLGELDNISQRLVSILDRLRDVTAEIEGQLPDEIGSPKTVEFDKVLEAHSLVGEAMFLGVRAAWFAFGGPSIRKIGVASREKTAGGPSEGAAPDGAFGFNGQSFLHTFDSGIAELHVSALLTDAGKAYSNWTYVAGFGPGSGEHAILDARAVDLATGAAKIAAGKIHELLGAHVALASSFALRPFSLNPFILVAQLQEPNPPILSPIAVQSHLPLLRALRTAVADSAAAVRNIPDKAERLAWLGVLAGSSYEAAVRADGMLNAAKKPVANLGTVLMLAPPPAPNMDGI
jgi:murein DD-endopeptidase MepM/ murein hydrolase activator NlpD